MALKILLTSDFHGKRNLLEAAVQETEEGDYDLFINLGDYTDQEYAEELFERMDVPAIGCTGNRDMFFEDEFLDSETPVYNFLDADIDEEYKVILLGGDFPENVGEQISEIMDDHGEPKKVLIGTHFPPKKANDRVDTGRRIGFEKFRELILREKPAVWASGHVHEDFGTKQLRDTLCLNAASEATGKGFKLVMGEDGVQEYQEVVLDEDVESAIL